MQVTIDSSEPLEKVLPVVGAMYGVVLTTAEPDEAVPAQASSGRRRAATSSRGGGGRARRRTAVAAPDAASVRTWARANGHVVRDRGRVPSAITAAYLDAGSPSS